MIAEWWVQQVDTFMLEWCQSTGSRITLRMKFSGSVRISRKRGVSGLSRTRFALSHRRIIDIDFWASVPELDDRYLRVVTLGDKITIHNAFLDRRFKP